MNIYVGNLPHATTDQELREAFEEFGTVASATIITDRETGRSRGFGFVEMPSKEEANEAISGMNGEDFGGRTLTVNEARPRERRPGGSGGGRGGSSYSRGDFGTRDSERRGDGGGFGRDRGRRSY